MKNKYNEGAGGSTDNYFVDRPIKVGYGIRNICDGCIHSSVCIANLRGTACEDCMEYHGTCEDCRHYSADKFGIYICNITEFSMPSYGYCESWEGEMP